MKLVTQFHDSDDAERVSKRLRNAGVMTVITGKELRLLNSSKTGTRRLGLWVVFDDQHADAMILLDNPNHKPARKIPLSEMVRLEKEAKARFPALRQQILEKLAALVFGALLAAFAVYAAFAFYRGL